MGGLMNEAETRALTNVLKLCLSVMEYYLTIKTCYICLCCETLF